jgi:nucleoside-diphosphate-sugar epimerase
MVAANKCIITGCSGFIGGNLVTYLKQRKITFKSLSRNELSGIENVNLPSTNAVIHLAGKAHDVHKVGRPYEYYKTNFELTKRLYDAFLRSDAKKFIYVSSVKAVADEVDGVLTENIVPNPQTDYGISKLLAEQYIQEQPLPEGKSFYILRPCMTHGEGNKGNLNLLYKFIQKGLPYPLASYNNKRSFLSIQNLCFIINEIINRDDISKGIYHLADDEALSTAEVVTLIGNAINKKTSLWKIPERWVNCAARVGDTFHLPLTTERLSKLTSSYVVSNAKIKAAINKSLPITAREGILHTATSFAPVNHEIGTVPNAAFS